jgi:hypothetical protein
VHQQQQQQMMMMMMMMTTAACLSHTSKLSCLIPRQQLQQQG